MNCEGFETLYSDFIDTRNAWWDSRVQAGQAWRSVVAASTVHRAAGAT